MTGTRLTTNYNSGIPADYGLVRFDTSRCVTFRAGSNYTLNKLGFEVSRSSVAGIGYINIYLRGCGAGWYPQGTYLGMGSINADVFSTSPTWHTCNIGSFQVTSGNIYAMELQTDGDVLRNLTMWGNHNKPGNYVGSSWYGSGSTWTAEPSVSAGSMFNYHFTAYEQIETTVPEAQGYLGLGGGSYLRLISTTDAESDSNLCPAVRVDLNGSILCADLVDPTSDWATNVRVYKSGADRSVWAWRGSGAI